MIIYGVGFEVFSVAMLKTQSSRN